MVYACMMDTLSEWHARHLWICMYKYCVVCARVIIIPNESITTGGVPRSFVCPHRIHHARISLESLLPQELKLLLLLLNPHLLMLETHTRFIMLTRSMMMVVLILRHAMAIEISRDDWYTSAVYRESWWLSYVYVRHILR